MQKIRKTDSRPAVAMPLDSSTIRSKTRQGLEELERGEGIPGEEAEAELKRMSKEIRRRNAK